MNEDGGEGVTLLDTPTQTPVAYDFTKPVVRLSVLEADYTEAMGAITRARQALFKAGLEEEEESLAAAQRVFDRRTNDREKWLKEH